MKFSIPWQVWAGAAILIAVFVAFKLGQWDIRQDWKESVKRGNVIVEELQKKADEITIQVQERVVYRDRTIEKQGKTRTVVREVFVPVDSGNLSGGFRLYHDAAATDTIPDPARIPDAAPVAITDVADTIEYNYQQCHKAYARLEEWNRWAAEQKLAREQAIAEYESNNGR